MEPWEALRSFRRRARMSRDELAKALGMSRASSLSRYEDPAGRKDRFLPIAMVERLAKTLAGRGEPPIQLSEIMALAGVDRVIETKHSENDLPPTLVELPAKSDISLIDLHTVAKVFTEFCATSGSDPSVMSAIRIKVGDNTLAPTFARGEELVVDFVEPYRPGDFVLAQMADEKEPSVRRYAIKGYDNGKPLIALSPINPAVDAERIISDETPGIIFGRITERRIRL